MPPGRYTGGQPPPLTRIIHPDRPRRFATGSRDAVWFSPSAPRGAGRAGRLAQGESASFTPKRSLVRSQYRPPARRPPPKREGGLFDLVQVRRPIGAGGVALVVPQVLAAVPVPAGRPVIPRAGAYGHGLAGLQQEAKEAVLVARLVPEDPVPTGSSCGWCSSAPRTPRRGRCWSGGRRRAVVLDLHDLHRRGGGLSRRSGEGGEQGRPGDGGGNETCEHSGSCEFGGWNVTEVRRRNL